LVVAVVGLTLVAAVLPQFLPDPETGPKVPASVRTGPQPRVELDQEPIHDFGRMSQHDQGKHTWTVKNRGEGDLELWLEGKPTCSCTIAKLEHGAKALIKPGESTTIDLEWNTKDFHDDYSQGAIFGTNDPNRPEFRLNVKGKVYPPVVVFPPESLKFPTISNEETHQARIAVFSLDRPTMKLTRLETSRPDLIVAEPSPLNPKEITQLKVEKGYNVTVQIKPGMPQGVFQEELLIYTDHPKQGQVKVTLMGNISGAVSVVPDRLQMINVPGRQGGSGTLALLVRGGRETQFEVVRKPDKVEVTIERDDTASVKGRYRMKVTVPPGTAAGKVGGQIILKTDHPHVSEVKIPVTILISSGTVAAR
jgi:hypothetical protein